MKQKRNVASIFCALFLLFVLIPTGYAQDQALNGSGSVRFQGRKPTNPVDPENPLMPVTPGGGGSTEGDLRFDFAPSINFGSHKITEDGERLFYAHAQMYHDGTEPRGNHVQITDHRNEPSGWSLQVRQEHPFRNESVAEETEKELKGSILSFDNGWANSAHTAEVPPKLTKDTLQIDAAATTYLIATAEAGEGCGTWLITFGASQDNEHEQPATLSQKLDEKGNPVFDEMYGEQPVYHNEAVSLMIPDSVKLHPGKYQTELTWILAALP